MRKIISESSLKNRIILIALLVVIVLIIIVCLFGKRIVNKSEYNVQIIQYDTTNGSNKVVEEIIIRVGDIVKLSNKSEYKGCGSTANDIKILEINDNTVKISRDKIKYRFTGEYAGKSVAEIGIQKVYTFEEGKEIEKYTEEVIEEVEFDSHISISINESIPSGPECSLSRYGYYLKFVK